MMKKITSVILMLILASLSAPFAAARQTGDWNAVKNLTDREIAVKTRAGQTVFGVLRSASDDQLEMQVASKKSISNTATAFRRDEIEKLWLANLRFGGRRIGRGALVGLGAGAAVGTGVYLGGRSRDDDGLAGAVIPLAMVYGAGIGAVAGIFVKKSHKKKNLVYSL